MNDLAPILENLAEQLGTTVEYLWPLLVKQTQIDWIAWLLCSFILLSVSLVFTWRLLKIDHVLAEPDTGIPFIFSCVTGALSFISILFSIGTISHLLVPEAATIQRVLEMVG